MVEHVVNNNISKEIVNGDGTVTAERKKAERETEEIETSDKGAYTEHDSDFGDFAVEYPGIRHGGDDKDDGVEVIWPTGMTLDNNENTLVVVLLGWAGALDKHLAKYSDIYLSRGCIIVRYTSPPKVVMYHHDKLPRLTSKLIQRLKEFELDNHPTFFHIFSNGGGFTYSYMLAELTLQHRHLDIRGTIFDSSPAPRELGSYFRALLNIFEPYNGIRYVMAAAMVALLIFSIFWTHMKTAFRFCMNGDNVGFDSGRPTHNWLGRITQYRNHNFLFIYSDGDDIIRSHQVEKIANFLKEQDNRVTYLKFTDSLHVQHYRKYPKEYVSTITNFIREAMKDEENLTHFPTQY